MKSKLHAAFGVISLLCIVTFWTSTLVSELFLSEQSIVAVKNGILRAMWLFIPLLIATGASGFVLSMRRRGVLVDAKKRRMQVMAANGLLVLLPCAIALAGMANAGRFDTWFYAIQSAELIAGAANILLLALNMRDGLRLNGRLQRHRHQFASPK